VSLYVGIDPGLSGAIAVFDLKNGKLTIHDMPTMEIRVGKSNKNVISERQLVTILDEPKGAVAFCEKVNAMPGQGVTSMFNFGMGFGIVRGVLAALGYGYTLVTPAQWKKKLGVPQGKDGSRHRAMELFPAYAELFRRKKDDGRAEAALIAYWGAVHFDGKKFQENVDNDD